MHLRADFDKRAVVYPTDYQWVSSPMPGVERMMLDRVGEEKARATSLVRYAPHSEFSPHRHGGGEEFLVLEGQFEDEHGVYPQGTYVRNPIGTQHQPRIGEAGATIFVKLRQFETEDTRPCVIQTHEVPWRKGLIKNLEAIPLHTFGTEQVSLVKWAPHTQFERHQHFGGEEILVLTGAIYDEYGSYPAGSWLRNPHQSHHAPFTQSEGAVIYLKKGHLLNPLKHGMP